MAIEQEQQVIRLDTLARKIVHKELMTLREVNQLTLAAQQASESFASYIEQRHVMPDDTLLALKSEVYGVPIIDVFNLDITSEAIELIPKHVAQENHVIPIEVIDGTLVVALSDPMDFKLLSDLRLMTKKNIELRLAIKADIASVIANTYPSDLKVEEWISDSDSVDEIANEVVDEVSDAPVVRLVSTLLTEAVDRKASDIHFDPQLKELLIRIRVDGELVTMQKIPKTMQHAVISRVKVISSLDITETRIPQDGRAQIKNARMKVDLRVSILPVIHGEKVVIRILDTSAGIRQLDDSGFAPDTLDRFRQTLKLPHGIILVTGPTGSGKSSTLYSALNELNQPNINIITVEDPVEYQLAGINQVAVNADVGLTFAAGLRSILRQDPNVVMVGEIRDGETAEIAIRAAMTGHMVLSTLHTNSAVSTINRLLDMGVDTFLVANALSGVLAQRLVRCICSNCKTTVHPSVEEEIFLKHYQAEGKALYTGLGCNKCGGTGYKGRMAVHEFFALTPDIRHAINNHATDEVLADLAEKSGMRTLFADGLSKVLQGYTTIAEILKVAEE
ncbi:GspE/PulE family protein [Pseudolactococcus plantarum]|jgi:type IV pilus assembly protein PilB|uniref:Type II secretion system protein E n=1 Tax=Pseudolactococcus plantarum TaxID=1365 RepID=A0A2A5S446_9LACT|nr:GspE/PulE family protein [Lactococcus plantarum]MBR6896327.1 type II/IV secretion system protein [Lactococcus sp.]PCS08228.1 type II secretion system protein E [Lactococcus plantarum]HCN75390.1 type II/IV secretion system protein [Lactococcus sp.]